MKKIKSKLLLLRRSQKVSLQLLCDYVLLVLSFFLSLWLRENLIYIPTGNSFLLVLIAPILALPIFYLFGLYKSLIRYSNIKSLFTIIKAVTLYTIFWFLIVVSLDIVIKPYDFLIIQWMLTTFFISSVRYLAQEILIDNYPGKNVLIYGAGSAGIQLEAALKYDQKYNIVGFIDEKKDLDGKFISGREVFPPSKLDSLIKKRSVSEIFVALPSLSSTKRALLFQSLTKHGVVIRSLPRLSDLADGRVGISDMKKIKIDDLLRRKQRKPIHQLLQKDILDKNILITGAGGSIGSELAKQILDFKPRSLILFDISEYSLYKIGMSLSSATKNNKIIPIIGNVNNQGRLENLMKRYSIDTVYHAAAYKHVPLVETNAYAAVRCNIFGTLACIRAAINQEVKSFVFISTDKAVRPTNVMGASKRFAEQILQSINKASNGESKTRVSIVRFGNVLGSSGSVVPLFRDQIKKGGPLTVTDPGIIRYFMTLSEASQLVIQAGAMGSDGDIFLLDMGEPKKIIDLAKDMIKLSGKSIKDEKNPDGDIEIKFTGLRKGEKLYEELLIDSKSEPTEHERIFIAKDKFLPWEDINRYLGQLSDATNSENIKEIIEVLEQSVDGFKPQSN